MALVPFHKLHVTAGPGLAAVQATHSCVEPLEGTRVWLKLAYLTACVTLLNTIIKRIDAVGTNEILQGFSLRTKHFHLDIVMLVGAMFVVALYYLSRISFFTEVPLSAAMWT